MTCLSDSYLIICTGVSMGPVWGPAAVGAVLGAAYAALNRLGMKRIWRAPHSPLNVVVTGGTKGLGKAMAREFLRYRPGFQHHVVLSCF